MTDKRTWWIDPVDESSCGVHEAFRKHPGQGPLQWQGRLVEVAPASEVERLKRKIKDLNERLRKAYGKIEYCYIGLLRGGIPDETLMEYLKQSRDLLYEVLRSTKSSSSQNLEFPNWSDL